MAHMVARLPARFQQGKMPYVFFFVAVVIAVLLTYAMVSPYPYANVMFSGFAFCLVVLLVLINHGFSLNWATHLATGLGAVILFYAAWATGGVYSPRLAWMLILPLTPFYVINRRAGIFWLLVVMVLQLIMAVSNHLGWIQSFETGMAHVLSSFLTYTLVTCVLIVVPLMYDHMYRQALEESREHQRQLEAGREALEHASVMREHFIATVSHELRTPMNAILGFNALLLARVQGKPEALKVLNHTRQSADHLMTVINDILDYSQLQSGQLAIQPETFELRHTAEHAFELFKPRVESMDLEYRLVLDPALPVWVHTDRHRLMQVLVNLLGNALKFTHQGSVVLQVRWTDPGVEFSVQDTGIGIPADRLGLFFQDFSQAEASTTRHYGGSGLGLADGSTLPPPAPTSESFDRVFAARHPMRILVVEDNPVNQKVLVRMLERLGYAPVAVADGRAAVGTLRSEAFELVLMDVEVPEMDGPTATRALRSELSAARQPVVVALTAHALAGNREHFLAAGMDAYLAKPIRVPELLAILTQLPELRRRAS